MEPIDAAIQVLQRVKNCDKALSNLKQAQLNVVFTGDLYEYYPTPEQQKKVFNHLKELISEAIDLIEGGQ